jgi:hypothetical protein
MENIDLSENVKLDESCVIVDNSFLYEVSRRNLRLRSYKVLLSLSLSLCVRERACGLVAVCPFFFFWGGDIWSCAYIFQVKEEFICSYATDNFSNMKGEQKKRSHYIPKCKVLQKIMTDKFSLAGQTSASYFYFI